MRELDDLLKLKLLNLRNKGVQTSEELKHVKQVAKKTLRIDTKLEDSKTFEQTTHKMENPNLHSSNSSGTNTMKTNSATSKQRN